MRPARSATAAPLNWRGFFADTLALVTFFTCTGILNERFIAGMDWPQVIDARLIGAPLMVLTAVMLAVSLSQRAVISQLAMALIFLHLAVVKRHLAAQSW